MSFQENTFNWFDVTTLLGMNTNQRKNEIYIPCPFCGSQRFAMNQSKGIGHCFKCDASANSVSYYSAVMGITLSEAFKEIKERLGINDFRPINRPERTVIKVEKEKPMAPIKDVDFTYRSFLELLTLEDEDRNDLLARGFSPQDIEMLGYKTFPDYKDVNYYDLCNKLLKKGCVLEGVAGFYKRYDYKTDSERWTFIHCKKGVIIPQKTVNNQIFGFQVRKRNSVLEVNEETGEVEHKCLWFSSRGCKDGCGCRADINFSTDFKYDANKRQWAYFKDHTVILTEGGMKADLVHCLKPNLQVISVAGVNSTTYLEQTLKYLGKLGVKKVIQAYDMDYLTNESVDLQLRKTREIILNSGMEYEWLTWDTKVNGQELLKGIDDYLAYHMLGIIPKVKEGTNHGEE